MNLIDDTHCPLTQGYCLYEKCPYWDHNRQECDADCLKSEETHRQQPGDGPCTVHWTEDFD